MMHPGEEHAENNCDTVQESGLDDNKDSLDAYQKGCCSPAAGAPTSDLEIRPEADETACQRGCCSSTLKMDTATQSEGHCDCCQEDEDEDVDACVQECCSMPLKMGEGAEGKNQRGREGYGVSVDDDDDSLCPCCIEILVQHPDAIGRTLLEAESSDPALFPKNSVHRLFTTVRKCCRLFESFCAQKPCCFPVARPLKKGPAVCVSVPSACTLSIVLLAIPVLLLTWAHLPGTPFAHGLASVVLTTLIQVAAFPILSSTVRSIVFTHAVDMSVLVSVSSLSAWIYSLVSFAFAAAGKPFADPFFETVALLVALVHIGRLVQAATRRTTSSAIRELQQLQPANVILVEQVGNSTVETELDARLLYYGDVVRLGPASRIPTDGMVVAGSSAVDESSVTGESLPCTKQVGSSVTAGTLNLDGVIDIQITQLVHENYLVRIMNLVRQAQASRSPFQDLADRFSAVVLPVSAGCSVIAFVVWFLVNRYGRHLSSTTSAVSGLTYALAILIVSCPCAIGVAVPLVVAAALRAGRGQGVLFRSSEALQTAHNVDVVVFDKTGTLSRGVFSLERKEFLAHGVEKIIHPLISTNEHPVSKAVLGHVSSQVFRPPQGSALPQGIISLPGMGVKATLAGYPLLGGKPEFTGAAQHPLIQEFTASGLTLFTVTLAGELVAAFGLADTPRADASALLEALAARGKRVFVLSGDHAGAVARFAALLPIHPGDAQAACTPAGKAEFIKAVQARGQRVCFVGDGTNDAPALAQADVALCVAGGADVAVAAARALVAGDSMRRGVLGALDVAKHAQQHMVVALGWCVFYNAAALLFAGGAFVRVRVAPQWAGLGELVSLVPVLVVGLALDLRWRWRRQ